MLEPNSFQAHQQNPTEPLGTLGGALDAQALARLVEWYAVGWDKVAAGDE